MGDVDNLPLENAYLDLFSCLKKKIQEAQVKACKKELIFSIKIMRT